MGAIQPWHIILIVVVFLLLFGGKKLPDAARGLGRSLRILKSEVGAMHDEDSAKARPAATETESTAAVATPLSQIAPAPIAQPVVQVPGAGPVAAPAVPAPATNGYAPTAVPSSGLPAPLVVPVPVAPPVINVPVSGPPAS